MISDPRANCDPRHSALPFGRTTWFVASGRMEIDRASVAPDRFRRFPRLNCGGLRRPERVGACAGNKSAGLRQSRLRRRHSRILPTDAPVVKSKARDWTDSCAEEAVIPRRRRERVRSDPTAIVWDRCSGLTGSQRRSSTRAGWIQHGYRRLASEFGLGQYEAVFHENEIDVEVLPELTESDLIQLRLPLGHR